MKGYLVHTAEAQRSHWWLLRRGEHQTWEMGSSPPGSEQVPSWVTAHHLPAGSGGLGGPPQAELLPRYVLCCGLKVMLLGSNGVCKDRKKSETPNKKATLLGFCDNKLNWKGGKFTFVQKSVQNCNCRCIPAFPHLQNGGSSVTSQGPPVV